MNSKNGQTPSKISRKVILPAALCACLLHPAVFASAASASFDTAGAVSVPAVQAIPTSSAGDMPLKPPPAGLAAEAKISKEQAIEKIKSLFPKLRDLEPNNVQLGDPNSFPPQYQNVWSIDWQVTNGRNSYGLNSKVDSLNGDLLQMNFYNPGDQNKEAYYPPKLSREEALEMAKAFIRKASPSVQVDSLQSNDRMKFENRSLFGPVRYDFSFTQKVNGLPAQNESIYLTVTGNGEVTNYNRSVAAAPYPSSEPKITKEEAERKFTAENGLDLQYIPIYRFDNRAKEWFLGLSPHMFAVSDIDAQTGEFLDPQGNPIDPATFKYNDVAKTTPTFSPVSGTGEKGLLTAEQAEERIKQAIGVPAGKTLAGHNLNNYDGQRQVWNLFWRDEQPAQPYSDQTSAAVDAKTGQIVNYHSDFFGPPWIQPAKGEKEEAAKKISPEAALEKAVQLVNQLYPNASADLKLNTGFPQLLAGGSSAYSFQFQRFYNGFPVGGEAATLSLDATGKLTSYDGNRTENLEESLKSLKASVSKEDAAKTYLAETYAELQYRSYGGFYTGGQAAKPSVKLVYGRAYKDPEKIGYVIDAADGKWRPSFIDPSLRKEGAAAEAKDIAGHWAEADLKAMLEYGVLQADAEGALNPNAPITLGDWVTMFAKGASPYYDRQFGYDGSGEMPVFKDVDKNSPYYPAAQFFIQSGWLDPGKTPELHPEKALTREMLAASLVQLVKYNKLAGLLPDRTPSEFADVDQIKEKGAVSLAAQLGLMTGIDGAFKPQETVTKAQAAAVLMKLVRLQGKLDQPIVN